MVSVHVVTPRRTTGRLAGAALLAPLLAVSFAASAPAQEDENLLISELISEVRKLRAEISAVRNENEILRHRFEALLGRLGVELEESLTSRRAAPALVPTPEDFVRHGAVQGGADVPSTVQRREARESQRRPFMQQEPSGQTFQQREASGEQAVSAPEAREVSARASGEQAVSTPEAQEISARASGEQAVSQRQSSGQAPKSPVRKPSDDKRRFALAGRYSSGSTREREAYFGALAYINTGQYDDLRGALRRFLEDHPGGAYEAKARYWIADSYYTEERHDQAAQHFERYLERFPNADKADDARLKLADVYYRRDELPAAQRLLEGLVDSRNERVRKLAARKLDLVAKASRR